MTEIFDFLMDEPTHGGFELEFCPIDPVHDSLKMSEVLFEGRREHKNIVESQDQRLDSIPAGVSSAEHSRHVGQGERHD